MSTDAPRPGTLTDLGHFLFRTRNGLFPLAMLVLIFGFRPRPLLGAEWEGLVDLVGLLIAGGGQLLRMAVIGFAYIVRGGRNRRIYADDLVTEGFFAHCRNPMYVGNLAMYWGLLIVHGNPWTVVLGFLFYGIAYLAITLAEEGFLRQQFGEQYEAYCRAVPRFGFKLAGIGATLAGGSFDWRKVIRKEYGTVFTWVSTVFLLLGWQAYARDPDGPWRGLAETLGGVWVALLLAYLLARFLKKSGRLGQDEPSAG